MKSRIDIPIRIARCGQYSKKFAPRRMIALSGLPAALPATPFVNVIPM
jgi:hypothetical protein